MKHQRPPYGPASSSPAESAAFATLGLVGIAAIGMALISASMPPVANKNPVTDVVRYVRTGQAVADMRSLGAMMQFLLDTERGEATNGGWDYGQGQKNAPVPTNGTAEPKV